MSAPHTSSLDTSAIDTFAVDLGTRSYPIVIGGDLLGSASTYAQLPRAASALIVSNTTVAPLYAAQLQAACAQGTQAWCIFDNTALGHATRNALELQAL